MREQQRSPDELGNGEFSSLDECCDREEDDEENRSNGLDIEILRAENNNAQEDIERILHLAPQLPPIPHLPCCSGSCGTLTACKCYTVYAQTPACWELPMQPMMHPWPPFRRECTTPTKMHGGPHRIRAMAEEMAAFQGENSASIQKAQKKRQFDESQDDSDDDDEDLSAKRKLLKKRKRAMKKSDAALFEEGKAATYVIVTTRRTKKLKMREELGLRSAKEAAKKYEVSKVPIADDRHVRFSQVSK